MHKPGDDATLQAYYNVHVLYFKLFVLYYFPVLHVYNISSPVVMSQSWSPLPPSPPGLNGGSSVFVAPAKGIQMNSYEVKTIPEATCPCKSQCQSRCCVSKRDLMVPNSVHRRPDRSSVSSYGSMESTDALTCEDRELVCTFIYIK